MKGVEGELKISLPVSFVMYKAISSKSYAVTGERPAMEQVDSSLSQSKVACGPPVDFLMRYEYALPLSANWPKFKMSRLGPLSDRVGGFGAN